MIENKTLLVSCATLSSGGAERVLSILSHSFAEEYERTIYIMWVHAPIFYLFDERVELVDIEKEVGSKSIWKKMRWFRRYVKKEKPDLILSFLYPWSMKVILSLLFTPFKIVVAERRDPRRVTGGWFVRLFRDLLYHRAEGILVQTEGNRKYYYGLLRNKTHAIYNPVGIEEDSVGKGLISMKENVMVTVGRLRFEKNHSYLINAFAIFHESHPAYSLIIYGEGEEREKLQKKINEMGLSSCVHLPGNTDKVVEAISKARMFVLSSIFEGMPNALIEAMCVGLPCISTKVSGATDLIEDSVNGLLVDVGNVNQLVDAMSRIADNEQLGKELASNAIRTYDKVNKKVVCQEWINYINLHLS